MLSPGDPVLAVTMGAFGDRFAKVAEVYGAAVTRLEIEWGEAAEPGAVRDAAARDRGTAGRSSSPTTRPSTGVTSDIPRAGGRGPRGGARRADPRGRDLRAGGGAVRDGRLGARPRRHGLAEGLDVRARHGDGRRGAACLGGRRDGADAALLPRPQAPPRHAGERREPLDAGGRGDVPGGRGAAPDGRRRATGCSPVTRRAPR